MRTLRATTVLLFALTLGEVTLAQAQRHSLDIKSQPIKLALRDLGEQTGIQILFRAEDVARQEVTTPPVSGEMSPKEALERILEMAPGLKYEWMNAHTVLISAKEEREAETVGYVQGAQVVRVAQADTSATASTEETSGNRADPDPAAVSSEQPAEIVVTAQKRAERTIDVPMSITALSGEQLVARGIANARDLSYAVPGLAVSETGPGRQIIVVRGIGSIRGSSSLTGVYLDEMPVTGAQAGFVAAYPDLRVIDLERVEVLKGPQGTLFGEGAAGGVIRYITKDPDLTGAGGSVSTDFYNTSDGDWSEEITGIVNVPFSESFGVRLAGVYEDVSGWIDQPSTGREDINDSEVKHVRLKALYAPSAALKIRGTVELHRNDGGASNVVNQFPRGESHFVQAVDLDAPTDYTDDYDLFNVAVTYDFGFAELLSSSSYAKLDNVQSFTQFLDQEPVPLEILLRELTQNARIASQEIRLTSSTDGPVNWTVGATYKEAKLSGGFGEPGLDAIIFIPGPGVVSISGAQAGNRPTTKSESWAAFANASYELTSRIEVGGGLRYFNDRPAVWDPTLSQLARVSDSFDQLTFRTYLKYQAADDANLYVSVANGFRSGGFNNPNQVALGAPSSFGPEKTIFYEAGAKTSLGDGRVRFDVAVFYGEFNGMQDAKRILSPVNPEQPVQFTSNGQDAELKGLEWDIGWSATERLTLSLSGDRTDSEITWVDPDNEIPPFFVGDPINLVPKYSWSTTVDYQFHWSDTVPGFFRLSFDKQGQAYYSDRSNGLILSAQDRQAVAAELDFLNASVGGEWSGWKWNLFGRNLLEENGALNAAVEGWTAQARPRTFGISLGKSF